MVPALLLIAALVASPPAMAQAPAQSEAALVERAVGPWELSNPSGSRKCAVTFRAERVGLGRGLTLAEGCATAFPAVTAVAAWSVAPTGAIRWLDRAGQPAFDFEETEVGIFESLRAGDPTVYFLTNLGLAGKALPTADEVSGAWSLGQPTGRALCSLALKEELAADAGALEQRFALEVGNGCERSVAALGLGSWRLDREILVVLGRGGNLSFRREDSGRWVKTPADNRPLVLTRP
jgi:hypothetical protein